MNWDLVIVVVYLVSTLLIGLHFSKATRSVKKFSISNRKLSTPVLSATLLATMIGGGHTVGIAAQIFEHGFLYIIGFIGAAISPIIMAKFVVPQMKKFWGLITISEVMGEVYGEPGKAVTAIMSLIMGFGTIGGQILALGLVLNTLIDIPLFIGILLGGGVVICYSAFGGVKAVTITDVLQFMILIFIIPIICNVAIDEIGGVRELVKAIPKDRLEVFDKSNFWNYIAMFFLVIFPTPAPEIIQRFLMAGSDSQLKKILYSVASLEIPFCLMIAGIGFSALVLFPDAQPKDAFSLIIKEFLPVGLKGVAIAGLLAVIMSTADSVLNATSIVVVHDLFKKIFPSIDEVRELRLIKLMTVVVGILSIVVAYYSKGVIDIILFFNSFWDSVIAVPLLAALIGIRANTKTFILSSVVGVVSLLLADLFIDESYKFVSYLLGLVASALAFFGYHFYLQKEKILCLIDNIIQKNINLTKIRQTKDKRKLINFNIVNFSQDRVLTYGAEYYLFSIFVCINYVLPYFMWGTPNKEHYFLVISIRVITGIMCVLLLLKDYWPSKIKKYLPLYWHITLLLYLPFNTTFIFLLQHGSTDWLLNLSVAIFILIILVDWLSFIVITISGMMLGYLLYGIVTKDFHTHLSGMAIYHLVYLAVFTGIIGLIFFRKKNRENLVRLESAQLIGGTIGHEITNYIAIIRGESNHVGKEINKEGYSNKEIQKSLDAINKTLNRASGLISIVMTQLKGESHKESLAEINISEAIEESIEELGMMGINKNKILLSEISNFSLLANKNMLKHVFINLIKNSFDHNKNNPDILVEIICYQDKQNKVIKLKDNGCGITPQHKKKIFDLFYSKGRSGLGLAFCKKVVESMGGSIYCKSRPKEFTEFKLNFPIIG